MSVNNVPAQTQPAVALRNATRASRAIGAMFFALFGGVWLGLWVYWSYGVQLVLLALVGAGAAGIFVFALQRYRKNHDTTPAPVDTPAKRRESRIFNTVNVTQWVAILVVGNVLNNIGLSNWVIPAAMFIIGLHFLPLGYGFAYRPHYVTGIALMLLAMGYPFVAEKGAADPIGCLGAGLVLWATAGWGLLRSA